MRTVIECVPNISEGRDPARVREIADAVRAGPGVRLLDVSSDPAHNRSVLTFVGDAAAVRAGVSALQVSLVDKNTGPDVQLATAVTDSRGRYRISVLITGASLAARFKTQPDLQARVSSNGVFVAASKVHYNASVSETLDVAIPARCTALASEYESLTASVAVGVALLTLRMAAAEVALPQELLTTTS